MTIEEKVSNIEVAVVKVEERAKSNTKRLDEVEAEMKETSSLVTAIKELAVETKYMRTDLNETIQRFTKLEGKDADKWEKFKWLLLTGTVTIILGFIALQIGLK